MNVRCGGNQIKKIIKLIKQNKSKASLGKCIPMNKLAWGRHISNYPGKYIFSSFLSISGNKITKFLIVFFNVLSSNKIK
jgi:hypothetical protein